MKVVFASDHAGFELKETLVHFVGTLGFETEDLGPFQYNAQDDYPDFMSKVAQAFSENPREIRGIIMGGSGQGEAIVANRFPNVRAVVFNGQYEPKDGRIVPDEIAISRTHNDANVLSLGARFLSESDARDAVKKWLETPFPEEERHLRRIKKIEQYPN